MKPLQLLAIVGSTKATMTASEASLTDIKRYDSYRMNEIL